MRLFLACRCLSGPCRSRKQCLRPTLLYNRPEVCLSGHPTLQLPRFVLGWFLVVFLFQKHAWTVHWRLQPSLRQVYYWAIGSNLVLRGAWTYKLSAHLRHNFKTVFFFSLLEMCRRFQWIFFRVEIAAIKLSNFSPTLPKVNSPIPLKDLSAEAERLLTASE